MKHEVGPKEAALKRQREAKAAGRPRPASAKVVRSVEPRAGRVRGGAKGSASKTVEKINATPLARRGKRGPAPGPETVPVLVHMEPGLRDRIDEYRVSAGHPTRTAAIRALLERGLKG